jgi:hypothetical protein
MIVDEGLLGGLDCFLYRLELLGDLQTVPSFLQHHDDAADMSLGVLEAPDDRRVRSVDSVIHSSALPSGRG